MIGLYKARRRTPVHAVPANAQASGSRYHGEMAMRYTLSDTDATVVATAPHARHMFNSNTCGQPQAVAQAWATIRQHQLRLVRRAPDCPRKHPLAPTLARQKTIG